MKNNKDIVIDGVRYTLSPSDWNLQQQILSRSRGVQIDKKQLAASEKLTDAVVQRLIGHTNVVYYNCETNAWNTNTYNGRRIEDQDLDTIYVQDFKSAMEEIPEFNQHYEFVASVTMTIDRALFSGWGKQVSNPEYSKKGTTVVGNIIVRNKQTGKYELYCKSWVGVHVYIYSDRAAYNGAFRFAYDGAVDPVFRGALIAAHTR